MKTKSLLWSLIVCFVMCVSVQAETMPSQQSLLLADREKQTNYSSSLWIMNEQRTRPQPSQLRIKRMQDATKEQYPSLLRKQGIRNENQIQRMVEAEVQDVPKMMAGGTDNHENVVNIVRHGEETLIRGDIKGTDFIDNYSHYFYKENAIVINNASRTIQGGKIVVDAPVAWTSPGNSLLYRQPIHAGLGVTPEQMSMLMSLDPLTLYNSQWQVVSKNATSWVVQSKLSLGDGQQSVIKITLDRRYDAAPTSIVVTQPYHKTVVQAIHYRKYKNVWICDRASVLDEVQGILTVKQDWVLTKQTPSQPFTVPGPDHMLVNDYRLLGSKAISTGISIVPTRTEASSLVHYFWNGKFPPVSELRRLQALQHPGEATPDPAQASSANLAPFLGGMLCLVGGVWMFKRRSQS